MTSRKKPGVAFWATVVVVAVLAYPLSFGPACWGCVLEIIPLRAVITVYRPLLILMRRGPEPIGDALRWYAGIGTPQTYYLPIDPNDPPDI